MNMSLDEYQMLLWQIDQTTGDTHGSGTSLDEGSGVVNVVDEAPSVEARIDDQRIHGFLTAAVHGLPERQATVIALSYEQGETLESIASTLGVSVSRAYQLRRDALRKLRDVCVANDVVGEVA
jgi:RNA polymerase sigma factor (sigma-70 family)